MKQQYAKICLVTTRNIFDAPCLDKYISLLDEPFDIIYWDKCSLNEECGALNYYKFNGMVLPNISPAKKTILYIRFCHFANRILKKNKYEKLIVFPTQMGWLIKRQLSHNYKNEFGCFTWGHFGKSYNCWSWRRCNEIISKRKLHSGGGVPAKVIKLIDTDLDNDDMRSD